MRKEISTVEAIKARRSLTPEQTASRLKGCFHLMDISFPILLFDKNTSLKDLITSSKSYLFPRKISLVCKTNRSQIPHLMMKLKLKKLFFLLIAIILSCMKLSAQTNYYETNKVFHEDGYSYKCDIEKSGMITLYNAENKQTYESMRRISTGKEILITERIDPLLQNEWTIKRCSEVVRQVFSEEEKKRCGNRSLGVGLHIDSKTGKPMEVYFCFHRKNPFTTIPVSTYRKIEERLLKETWFTLRAEAFDFNYIGLFWMVSLNEE